MKYFLSIGLVVVGLVVGLSLNEDQKVVSLGGFSGDTSYSTTTDRTWNTVSTKMLRTNASGALSSVIITNSTAGSAFQLRDATSTTDISSTTIAVFGSGATAGSYDFNNLVFSRGLAVLMTSGNIASTTITWK